MEVFLTINTPVGSLFWFNRSSFDQAESPQLELMGVVRCQSGRILEADRFTDDVKLAVLPEGVPQPVSD